MNTIDNIARSHTVEAICGNIGITGTDLEDLSQMIYQALVEYPDQEKIVDMYARGELKYFIARMIMNNWFSRTSPYYTTYQKYYKYIENSGLNAGRTEDDED